MADNVTANAGAGGSTFATDQDSGTLIHYPWSKLVWGPDDTFNKVDDASGKRLPVLAYLNGVNVSSSGLEVRAVQSGTWNVSGVVSLTGSVQVSIPGVNITLSSLQVVHQGPVSLTGSVQVSIPGVQITLSSLQVVVAAHTGVNVTLSSLQTVQQGPISLTGSVQVSIPGVNITTSSLQVAAIQSGTWNVAATGLISVTGTVQVAIGTAISVTGTVQVQIGSAVTVNSHLVSLTGSVQVSIPGVNITLSSLQTVQQGPISLTGSVQVSIPGVNISNSSLQVVHQGGLLVSITGTATVAFADWATITTSPSKSSGNIKASAGNILMLVCTTGGGFQLNDGTSVLLALSGVTAGTIHNFGPWGMRCATNISMSASVGVWSVTFR